MFSVNIDFEREVLQVVLTVHTFLKFNQTQAVKTLIVNVFTLLFAFSVKVHSNGYVDAGHLSTSGCNSGQAGIQ
jgi:hypothetical protein